MTGLKLCRAALCHHTHFCLSCSNLENISVEGFRKIHFTCRHICLQTVSDVSVEVIDSCKFHFYNYDFVWYLLSLLKPDLGLTNCNYNPNLSLNSCHFLKSNICRVINFPPKSWTNKLCYLEAFLTIALLFGVVAVAFVMTCLPRVFPSVGQEGKWKLMHDLIKDKQCICYAEQDTTCPAALCL